MAASILTGIHKLGRYRIRRCGLALVALATTSVASIIWFRPTPAIVDLRRLAVRREWAAAEQGLLRYLWRYGDDEEAVLLLAKVRRERDNPQGAIESLRRIDPSSAFRPQALYEEAEINWDQHRAVTAERCWREVVDLADRPAGTTNARAGQWAFWSLARLGDLYLLESRDDEARIVLWRLFQSVDRRDGAAVNFLFQLTVFDLESESPTIGIETLKPFVDADPNDVQAHRALASYQLRMGDTGAAGRILRELLRRDPLARGVYATWVQFLQATGDHAAARRALSEVPEGVEPTATMWRLRGRDHENHGEFELAVACYRKAVERAPRNQDAMARLAQALRAAGRKDDFDRQNARVVRNAFHLTELSALLGRFPRRPGNTLEPAELRQLAEICAQLEWYREAKAWHELIVARQPDASESHSAIRALDKKLTNAAAAPGAQ